MNEEKTLATDSLAHFQPIDISLFYINNKRAALNGDKTVSINFCKLE